MNTTYPPIFQDDHDVTEAIEAYRQAIEVKTIYPAPASSDTEAVQNAEAVNEATTTPSTPTPVATTPRGNTTNISGGSDRAASEQEATTFNNNATDQQESVINAVNEVVTTPGPATPVVATPDTGGTTLSEFWRRRLGYVPESLKNTNEDEENEENEEDEEDEEDEETVSYVNRSTQTPWDVQIAPTNDPSA